MARPSKQNEILKQAARLFTQSGYHGTSIDDIANAAGVTHATPYHHFTSKSDILVAIYSSVIDRMLEMINSHPDDLAPVERIRATMRDMLLVVEEMPVEVKVYQQEGPMLEAILHRRQVKQLKAREVLVTDYVVDALEEGMKAGQIKRLNPTLTALGILGMVSWAARWYRPHGPANAEEISELFFTIAKDGFASDEEK
jgi:TetR/AcrR family transcriptional regulator, cholesterol catabolism regulator